MNWSAPTMALSTRIRGSILNCIWGTSSKLRCPEIVLAVLNDPTKVDNFSSAAMRAFTDARRTLMKDIDRRKNFMESLYLHNDGSKLNGPVHGIMEYASALGISITTDGYDVILETPTGHKVNLCTRHLSHLRHVIRVTCRYSLLKQ